MTALVLIIGTLISLSATPGDFLTERIQRENLVRVGLVKGELWLSPKFVSIIDEPVHHEHCLFEFSWKDKRWMATFEWDDKESTTLSCDGELINTKSDVWRIDSISYTFDNPIIYDYIRQTRLHQIIFEHVLFPISEGQQLAGRFSDILFDVSAGDNESTANLYTVKLNSKDKYFTTKYEFLYGSWPHPHLVNRTTKCESDTSRSQSASLCLDLAFEYGDLNMGDFQIPHKCVAKESDGGNEVLWKVEISYCTSNHEFVRGLDTLSIVPENGVKEVEPSTLIQDMVRILSSLAGR